MKQIKRLALWLTPFSAALAQSTAPPLLVPQIADPSRLVTVYQQAAGQWLSNVSSIGTEFFAVLALIDMIWFGITLVLDRHTFESAVPGLARKLCAVGFFYTMMLNGAAWIPQIIDTFTFIGKHAAGIDKLGPSIILQTGVNIAGRLAMSVAVAGLTFDIFNSLGFAVAVVVILAAFTVICAQFVVALIDTFIGVGIGTLFLFFGASKWTVPYVERFFAFCVASGVKLMSLYLLVGIGMQLAPTWETLAANDGPSSGGFITGLIIGISALLFAFITWHCSRTFTSFLGGAPSLTASDAVAFLAPMASAAVSSALALSTIASGGAAAPAAAAAGSGTGINTGSGNGSQASGMSASSAPQSSGMSSAVGQIARAGVSALRSMPSSNGHGAPPSNGMGH